MGISSYHKYHRPTKLAKRDKVDGYNKYSVAHQDFTELNEKIKTRRKEQREGLERHDDLASVPRTVLPASTFEKATRKARKEGRLHGLFEQDLMKHGVIDPSSQRNASTQKPLQKRIVKKRKGNRK